LHLHQSQIQFFFWGREGPGFPAKLARMALVKGLRQVRYFVYSLSNPWLVATSLSTDLLAGFKGPLLKGEWGEEGKKEREEREREGENIEFHHLLLSII